MRPYVGDALVTVLLCAFCRVISPRRPRLLALYVFLFAAAVEIGQYFDYAALLGLADSRFFSALLGRTFSFPDLICYGVGCAAFAAAVAPQKDSDALHIPLMPKGDDRYLLEEQYYFYLLHGIFLYSGVIDEIEFPRVYRAMEREGISSGNGLYGHMRPRNGNTHIWYTTAPEVYIFRTALRAGDRARAKEILNALLSYSMSEEYHMCERFCDNDPWFVPWMPNASAMGRVLTMLLDLNAD